jgi:pimeloyl-ACP methyl ester carboxylesterase
MPTVLSKDGTAIAFDRAGSGPPLILVAGALSDRSVSAPGLIPLLQSKFTVFAYDRRGRGASGDTAPYAVAREVEDLDAIVSAAGGSAYAYGVSSGAALALEAAASGVALSQLALFEPPYRADESVPRPPADLAQKIGEMVSEGRLGDAIETFLTKAVGLPAEAVKQMRGAPMWPGLEAFAPSLLHDLAIMGDGSIPVGRIGSITVPTLVIASEASPPWLQKAVRVVAESLPKAQLRFLPGQFHNVPPQTLAPVLQEFFGGEVGRSPTSSRQDQQRSSDPRRKPDNSPRA